MKNIELINDIDDLSQFDCVYSSSQSIDVKKYPNIKFIFGPHFSVSPDPRVMDIIKNDNSVYMILSDWVLNFWKNDPNYNNMKLIPLPFGVDTEKFKNIYPISQRNQVFIYFKKRHPQLLNIIESFLTSKNIYYLIFNYDEGYDENLYIHYLKNSKYGIWIGCSESQGFGLQEALSSDVPLFVWNVKSLNELYNQNCPDIPATSIPYWDERCGEYFYNVDELDEKFNLFLSKIDSYKPREYVLENLSMEVCEQKLINLIKNM